MNLSLRTTHTKALLAIFNSSLIRYELNTNRRSNIHIYPDDWKRIKLPLLTNDSTRGQAPLLLELETLTDQMLSLNEQLQEKRSRFLRRLTANVNNGACPIVKITTALQNFDELTFAGFLAELKKQKIRLSLVQQDEWEPYFGDYAQACNTLKEQISETDKDIDTLVFDLYGLTPEEREIVMKG